MNTLRRILAVVALALASCGHNPPCGMAVGDPCLQPDIGDCCPNIGLYCHVDPPGGQGPGPGSTDYTCQPQTK